MIFYKRLADRRQFAGSVPAHELDAGNAPADGARHARRYALSLARLYLSLTVR